jgi:hypothetical protein
MSGIDEEWEAAMTALRDLQATASRLCGEAAQDKARAETIYENAIARVTERLLSPIVGRCRRPRRAAAPRWPGKPLFRGICGSNPHWGSG